MKLFGYDRVLAVKQKQSKVAYIQAATQLIHQQKSNLADIDRLLAGGFARDGVTFRNITFTDEYLFYKNCSPLFTAIDSAVYALLI